MATLSSARYVISDVDDDKLDAFAILAGEKEIPLGEALGEALDAYIGKASKAEKDVLVESGAIEEPKKSSKK